MELNPKQILITAATTASLIISAAAVDLGMSYKTVLVSVNGVTQPVSTYEKTVASILNTSGINYTSRDEIKPALAQTIKNGATISVRTAKELNVISGGKTQTQWVTEPTIAQVLAESNERLEIPAQRSGERQMLLPLAKPGTPVIVKADGKETQLKLRDPHNLKTLLTAANINLNPLDRTHTHLENGVLTVTVKRVTRGNVINTVEIPYKTIEKESDEVAKGQKKVESKGQAGHKEITRYQQKIDNELLVDVYVSERVTKTPQDEIILIGTADPQELAAKLRAKGQFVDDAGNPLPTPTYSGDDPRALAQPLVAAKGWSPAEFNCLVTLWDRESHWNPYAQNASSGAYGIPQSLPGTKMASAGADWQTNPVTQIKWGIGYIEGRYGTPCSALGHSNNVGWY